MNAVATSRRTLAWLLRAASAGCAILAAYAPLVGGPVGVLTLPILIQVVLVVVAVEVSSGLRTGLRVDALTLFTAWELLRGCVAPLIIQYVGADTQTFVRLGTLDDAQLVLFVGNAFFAAVIATRLGVAAVGAAAPTRNVTGRTSRTDLIDTVPVAPLIIAGLVGLVLRFPTPASVAGFLAGDVDALQSSGVIGNSGLLFASLILRPLFVAGVIIAIRRRRREGRSIVFLFLPLAFGIVFCLASYGLNRGTVAFSLIAFAVVFLERSGRALRAGVTLVWIGSLGAFFAGLGTLRSALWIARTGLAEPTVGLTATLQSVLGYAASPQLLGGVLPAVRASSPFNATTLLRSVISPVPGVPDSARTGSGTAVYNNVLYHSFQGKDQLLPSWFEGFVTFGMPGVIVIAIILGMLFAWSDLLRTRTQSLLGTFAATLFALWVTQAGVTSIGVIEQNTINFVLTPAAIAGITAVITRRPGPLTRLTSTRKVHP